MSIQVMRTAADNSDPGARNPVCQKCCAHLAFGLVSITEYSSTATLPKAVAPKAISTTLASDIHSVRILERVGIPEDQLAKIATLEKLEQYLREIFDAILDLLL